VRTEPAEECREEQAPIDAATSAGFVFAILAGSIAIGIVVIARLVFGLYHPVILPLAVLAGLGVGFAAAMWMIVSGGPIRR